MVRTSAEDWASLYAAAQYRVTLPSGKCLKLLVGAPCPELEAALPEHVACWALLTACNPGSQRLAAEENAARQSRLNGDLAGRACWQTESDGEGWPVESGVLVPGMPQEEAVILGARYGQRAVLCGARGEPVRLVWCPVDDQWFQSCHQGEPGLVRPRLK